MEATADERGSGNENERQGDLYRYECLLREGVTMAHDARL
jgi:hypothetical protein